MISDACLMANFFITVGHTNLNGIVIQALRGISKMLENDSVACHPLAYIVPSVISGSVPYDRLV